MYYFQDALINTLNGLSRGKVKSIAAQAICVLIAFVFLNAHIDPAQQLINPLTGVVYVPVTGVRVAVVYGGLAVVTLLAMDGKVRRVQWNRVFIVAGMVLVITMLLAAAVHPIGREFLYFAVIAPFLLPFMSVVFGTGRKYRWLFDKVAVAACVVSLFACFQSLYTVQPVEGVRYMGITMQPNRLAAICLAGAVAGYYLLYAKGKLDVLSLTTVALAPVVMILTESRTALMAYVLVTAVFLFLGTRSGYGETKHWSVAFLRVAAIVLVGLLLIVGIVVMRSPALTASLLGQETAPEEIASESAAYVGMTETMDQQQVDALSSGRITIYQGILRNLNAQGHDMNLTGNRVVVDGVSFYAAHNTVLEYAYRCGVPCGIAVLILEVMMLIYVMTRVLGGRRCKPEEMFAVLVFVAFLVESMLEVQADPGGKQLPYLGLVASLLLMDAGHENEN